MYMDTIELVYSLLYALIVPEIIIMNNKSKYTPKSF